MRLLHVAASQWRWLLVAWYRLRPAPDAQALISHIHKWGPCRWNGQYWYARCVVLESCTARIAC